MKKLYLVDVSSMFFRAFYAIPPLRTSTGLPTNALYGFLSMSIKLLRENRPDAMAYCFDRKEPSFRSDLYKEYKAQRSEMPEDLAPQIPYIRELTEKLGIFAIDKEKFEADDVIGTLALLGKEQNYDVSIVSGDKDFAQLVGDRISLYDTMKNIRYDRAGVVEKWGVEPEKMIDYLAIVGDSSDNIPGVRGVGPKGAQKLLTEYQSLDGIYSHLKEIKSESVRNKFEESKKAAYLAKKLVEIVTDVPLGVQIEDLALKPINKTNLKELIDKLEFHAFLRKLFPDDQVATDTIKSAAKAAAQVAPIRSQFHNKKKPVTTTSKSTSVEVGLDRKSLKNVQWTLSELKNNLKPYDDIWVVQHERGFCIGYDKKAIQVDASLKEIGKVLGSKSLGWRGFDIKNIWHSLEIENTITPKWDTRLAAYVVKAGSIEDFPSVYKQYTEKTVPDLASVEDFLNMELELEEILTQRLQSAGGFSVLNDFDLPLVPILYDMERRGILIDSTELKNQSQGLGTDITELEKKIHQAAGESFNIASPKQLAAILFEKLKVPVVRKTKTGYSTDSDVLSKLAAQYPICNLIIDYRELTKLKSTYVDALPQLVSPTDGRLHTHFNQALTQTGRLSSSNPNIQNIPIRTARGRGIRKAFIARPEHVLLSIDYSQIELRILAEITSDPGLLAAFKSEQDIHTATAAEIFSTKIANVTAEQRRMAKAVNFGIAYGQGVFGLSETLEISNAEAKKIIEDYFNKFKKVKDYMLETVQLAQEQGFVETIFGRRRYMDEFKSSSQMVRKFGERAAINAPIQGSASDLMKKAMIDVSQNSPVAMLLQVHDELLFECPISEVETEAQNIKQIMEGVAKFKVPLGVHVAWGKNWEDAHT